ncbi:MAG: hypothetical protein R3E66_15085 [bacterium]
MRGFFSRGGSGRLFLLALALAGCMPADPDVSSWPMRPLVYTENPEQTPEAAQVNEERLARQLVRGVSPASAKVEAVKPLPVLGSPELLGRAITQALLSRDEHLWDHVFVPVQAYSDLVRMAPAPAQAFVDGLQAKSSAVWDLFDLPNPSEARSESWEGLFEFVEFSPGDPRKLDGKPASNDEDVAQFWNGHLTLRYLPGNTTFDLPVSKVLKIQGDTPTYYLGSPIRYDSSLRVLVASGMHLKPELMRPEEYPYPLQVGSFWRYTRYPEGREEDVVDPEEMATAVVVEVVSVDRYDTLRLVRLRRSYNDTLLTKADEWWVATPRRIYMCDGGCRRNIEDTAWLLGYFASQAPIFTFPLKPGARWSAGGFESNSAVFTSEIGPALELPGGVFPSTLVVTGEGPLGAWDRNVGYPQDRVFVWGKGVVQRRLRMPNTTIIESLSEYRLMPSN